MTPAQKRTFFVDARYIRDQAAAYRNYVKDGHKASLNGHRFEQTIHNALLESSLAFLRKANEFFGKKSKASVRAFFPDYPLQWLWDEADRELLNNRVMHVSLCEALDGKYDWEDFYYKHLSEVERRFDLFIDRVHRELPELANEPA
jgi:hypothetical protein